MVCDWQLEHFQGLDGQETFQVESAVQKISNLLDKQSKVHAYVHESLGRDVNYDSQETSYHRAWNSVACAAKCQAEARRDTQQ